MLLTLLLACSSSPSDPRWADISESVSLLAVDGTLSWSIEFDQEAQEAGLSDCTYSRAYSGIEERSGAWLCADCDAMFRANVEMPASEVECYAQIGNPPTEAVESIGLSNESFFRSSLDSRPLAVQGAVTRVNDTYGVDRATDWFNHSEGGQYRFLIEGSFEVSETVGDPLGAFRPPKQGSCGWPDASPPPVPNVFPVAMGQQLPDGYFLDVCNEPVRLHSFVGRYLVIDISAMNCGPCQAQAETEQAFIEEMRLRGLDVEVITLLAPSLSEPFSSASQSELRSWADYWNLESPVLADRSWGYAAFGEELAYPANIIVAPNLEVIDRFSGFDTWDLHMAIISNDAAR